MIELVREYLFYLSAMLVLAGGCGAAALDAANGVEVVVFRLAA